MARRRVLERYNAFKLGWLRDSIFMISAVAVIFVVFRFIIGISIVGGDSMDPTLKDGNIVIYYRMEQDYNAGDIVSMRVPSGEYYIKRVAATGGNTVDIYEGSLHIDGVVSDDPHAVGRTEEETGAVIYPYTVRDGNVFVLGDNREVSRDSRMFGEVNLRQIKGKVIFLIGSGGIRRAE